MKKKLICTITSPGFYLLLNNNIEYGLGSFRNSITLFLTPTFIAHDR